jgi:hypothetical protein
MYTDQENPADRPILLIICVSPRPSVVRISASFAKTGTFHGAPGFPD